MMTNGIGRKPVGKDFAMAISSRARDYTTTSDYFESEIHSPTDSSEDSVEVKISPILARNKRKCAEPRKVQETSLTGPLKKRMCLKIEAQKDIHPFRPWSPKTTPSSTTCMPSSERSSVEAYFRPPTPVKIERVDEEQPIALIKKRPETPEEPAQIELSIPRVPVHPEASSMTQSETETIIRNSTEHFPSLAEHHSSVSKREQRNYKNMTRERRIEANARERTRVHTISAAFDTLRKSVPSYSHNQKLSKLSVLRIACSYIMTLSSIVNEDDSESESSSTTAACVDLVTKTIQREGKLRKKKDDDND